MITLVNGMELQKVFVVHESWELVISPVGMLGNPQRSTNGHNTRN
jgi:hypothetical protein